MTAVAASASPIQPAMLHPDRECASTTPEAASNHTQGSMMNNASP